VIPQTRPAKILLIEDSEIDTVIFKLMIKKTLSHPVVDTCKNGLAAIEKLMTLKSQAPDLLPDYIFLDLAMPVMDGWQFMDEYKRLDIDPLCKSKIYVLSSSIDKADIMKSHANPRVETFLSKPIDFTKIEAVFLSN
jgi:CheY-like chemotaxis protein